VLEVVVLLGVVEATPEVCWFCVSCACWFCVFWVLCWSCVFAATAVEVVSGELVQRSLFAVLDGVVLALDVLAVGELLELLE
jgi:hypothetical protein